MEFIYAIILSFFILSILVKAVTGYFYIGTRLKLRAFLYKYIDRSVSFDFQDMIYDLIDGTPPICHATIDRIRVYDKATGIYKPLKDITYKIEDSRRNILEWVSIDLNNDNKLLFNIKRLLINISVYSNTNNIIIIECDDRNFLKMLEYLYKRFSDAEDVNFIDEFKKDVELRKSILS